MIVESNRPDNVRETLRAVPADRPALLGPDRDTSTFGDLCSLLDTTRRALNGIGIGRSDRVALVAPNGPEMASAFLAISATTEVAPLNPEFTAEELDYYIRDLGANAVVVHAEAGTVARDVSHSLGIPVITLSPRHELPAGAFVLELEGPGAGPPRDDGFAKAEDVALILHTSGTTSKPKMVPLRHRNITASATHIAQTLALTPDDRCINIMPLFHIHGLVGAILASVRAGASAYCTPGFSGLHFFRALDDAEATWMTAVPTMYQTVLERARRNSDSIGRSRFRLLRSSSASLPIRVLHDLESVFGCPVIESYGMTEASHQMTSNPLPPATRRPGTVGPAAGPEVCILGDDGDFLRAGEKGEVCVRGPNVTEGYANNPKANAENFYRGWFRTGDQGALDEDGYLTITGRLKELINRGGEKISPLEVDDVLVAHPDVAQAVTFALPHDNLGEDVAAAVVLAEGATRDETALRAYCGKYLSKIKVPARILFVDEIPKGKTGKLQRIGLAQTLGLTS